MRLGEVLVAHNFVTVGAVEAALARQRGQGGRLGDNLVALGHMTTQQFAAAMAEILATTPSAPATVQEAGLVPGQAVNLILKFMLRDSLETAPDLAAALKLPAQVVSELLDEATRRKFLRALGTATNGIAAVLRFGLSDEGQAAARGAFEQNRYLGPAPVTLPAYQRQIQRQAIHNEHRQAGHLRAALGGLMIPPRVIEKLLPAVNAGRAVLLFGPPGNGKTSIASRIAASFAQTVYVPYAVEIAGQIMRVFDPGLHQPRLEEAEAARLGEHGGLTPEAFDDRWVPCRRPFAIAGGELTMEMLDLQYDPDTKFYEAPLHIKALNGVMLVDDFGRQRLSPTELLNRWIGPMEHRVEFLKLHTGKSFSLPADQLLMFSTNIDPRDIMDPAFLRRIPYKIKLFPPTVEEYRGLFETETAARGLTLPAEVFAYIVDALSVTGKFGLAFFQPKFICAQAGELVRATGAAPVLTRAIAATALANLYVEIESAEPGG